MHGRTEKPDAAHIEEQLEKLSVQVKNLVHTEFTDLLQMLRRPWKLMVANFLIGLARGMGMTVGITLLGAAVVSLIMLMSTKMIHLPVVGHAVGQFLALVEHEKERTLPSLENHAEKTR